MRKEKGEDKMTVLRTMSFGKYCQARWAMQYPDLFRAGQLLDMSIYEQEQLQEVKQRRFYVTKEQREILDEFCDRFIVKDPIENILKGLARDSRFVTKPAGGTFVYDKDLAQAAREQAANTAIAATVTTVTTNSEQSDVVNKKSDNTYSPTQTYPVYSDEERMQLAIKLERTPTDDNTLVTISDEWLNSVDMSQFLFVKDLNKQCEHVNEIDYHVLFYMIETGKLSPIEAKLILTKVGAETVLERRPYDLRNYGVPEFYHDDSSLISAMLKAKTFTYKYQKMLADGSPSEEHILERFKDWIKNEKSLAIEQNQLSKIQYDPDMEVTNIDINDKTVTLTYDDINEGDNLTASVEYDSKEAMLDDFVCFEYAFNVDPNQQYNIWGEMISINDYIRQLYVKYPHGIHGGFYATMKEAYEAGAACINEVA